MPCDQVRYNATIRPRIDRQIRLWRRLALTAAGWVTLNVIYFACSHRLSPAFYYGMLALLLAEGGLAISIIRQGLRLRDVPRRLDDQWCQPRTEVLIYGSLFALVVVAGLFNVIYHGFFN